MGIGGIPCEQRTLKVTYEITGKVPVGATDEEAAEVFDTRLMFGMRSVPKDKLNVGQWELAEASDASE